MISETPHAADAVDTLPPPNPGSASVVGDTAGVEEAPQTPLPCEIGGRDGPEPTRYGDWEKNGRCIDF